jgi:hypothetical protein
MNLYEFEEVVKGLDKKKFHINRTLGFDDYGKLHLESWSIFRKDMTTEEYFDPKNLVVLSSENGNTAEDIENLIKEDENANT